MRRASDFGITINDGVAVDMRSVKARMNAVVARSRDGLEKWLRGMPGCSVYQEHAQFESPHEIRIKDSIISAERIFLNVGGRAHVPDMPGIDRVPYLTNSSMLKLEVLPRHLLIVGGSYVGLEFAQMYRRFGSEVTVIEKGARLVAHEDEDVAAEVRRILEAEGIGFRTEAECIRLASRQSDVVVGSIVSPGTAKSLARTYCSRSGGGRTPTISVSRRRESQSMPRLYYRRRGAAHERTGCLGAG